MSRPTSPTGSGSARPGRTRRSSAGGSTRCWSWCASAGYGASPDLGAVRRPAAARGAGARAGQPADRAAARRAAGGARPQAAARHADRAAEPAARGRHHLRPGHPRPGGGAVDERHDLRPAQRPDRAAGLAARALYDAPASAWVADFVGKSNFLAGTVAARRRGHGRGRWRPADAFAARRSAGRTAACGWASASCWRCGRSWCASGRRARMRAVGGRVLNRIFLGEHTEYLVRTPDLGDLLALVPRAAEGGWQRLRAGRCGGAATGRHRPVLRSATTARQSSATRRNEMSRSKNGKPISAPAFLDELQRYRRGSVTRRHFMGVTGLGTATAVLGAGDALAAAAAGLRGRRDRRPGDAGDLAQLPRPGQFRGVHRAHRRQRAGQRVRLERGDAGQAAGGRHRLGRVRADQLHDQHLPEAGHHRAARTGAAAQFRPGRQRGAVHAEGIDRRQGLRGAQGLGHHRLYRQHRQGDGADDQLEAVLGHDPGRAVRPGHGARLSADHDRQRAQVFRLLVQLGRPGRAGQGRGAAARGQAASVRDHQRLPAGDAQWRRLVRRVLDRRRDAAAPRHARDAVRDRQGRRRDLERLLRRAKEAANRKGGYALINFLLDPAVNAKEVLAHGYPTTDSRVEKGFAAPPASCSARRSGRRRRRRRSLAAAALGSLTASAS